MTATKDAQADGHAEHPGEQAAERCRWEEDASGAWESACGRTWTLHAGGTPRTNDMQFCPFCGRFLEEA